MARRAGIKQANNATATRTTAETPKVIRSVGVTPNKKLLIKRVTTIAPPNPIATPMSVSFIPWPIINRKMCRGVAPRARKIHKVVENPAEASRAIKAAAKKPEVAVVRKAAVAARKVAASPAAATANLTQYLRGEFRLARLSFITTE